MFFKNPTAIIVVYENIIVATQEEQFSRKKLKSNPLHNHVYDKLFELFSMFFTMEHESIERRIKNVER